MFKKLNEQMKINKIKQEVKLTEDFSDIEIEIIFGDLLESFYLPTETGNVTRSMLASRSPQFQNKKEAKKKEKKKKEKPEPEEFFTEDLFDNKPMTAEEAENVLNLEKEKKRKEQKEKAEIKKDRAKAIKKIDRKIKDKTIGSTISE